jgi:hypothetical protein
MNYQTTIITAIVALIFLMVMLILGLGVAGRLDTASTPMIVTIFGTIATVVATLLNIIRTERAVTEVKETNGTVKDLSRRMELPDPGGSREPEGHDSTIV